MLHAFSSHLFLRSTAVVLNLSSILEKFRKHGLLGVLEDRVENHWCAVYLKPKGFYLVLDTVGKGLVSVSHWIDLLSLLTQSTQQDVRGDLSKARVILCLTAVTGISVPIRRLPLFFLSGVNLKYGIFHSLRPHFCGRTDPQKGPSSATWDAQVFHALACRQHV